MPYHAHQPRTPVRQVRSEAVAVAIMDAIRRYTDPAQPRPSDDEDQQLMEAIRDELVAFHDDITTDADDLVETRIEETKAELQGGATSW
jgi:hypothetical protein